MTAIETQATLTKWTPSRYDMPNGGARFHIYGQSFGIQFYPSFDGIRIHVVSHMDDKHPSEGGRLASHVHGERADSYRPEHIHLDDDSLLVSKPDPHLISLSHGFSVALEPGMSGMLATTLHEVFNFQQRLDAFIRSVGDQMPIWATAMVIRAFVLTDFENFSADEAATSAFEHCSDADAIAGIVRRYLVDNLSSAPRTDDAESP